MLQQTAPPPLMPESWRPVSSKQASVRDQPRYDQTITEEHPGVGDSDDDDDEDKLRFENMFYYYYCTRILFTQYRLQG